MTGRFSIVTGAAGFLGRNVSRALANSGINVIGIGHPAPGFDPKSWGIAQWIEGDVQLNVLAQLPPGAMSVFHCAGGASVALSLQEPHLDFRRTVETTAAVLEYCRHSGGTSSMILPSSAAVYGSTSSSALRIDDRLQPISPYGTHKKMAEELCRSYSRHFECPTAIVRLFSVYGPGLKKQLLWDACRKLSEGDCRFSGTGEERRDWIHVEDAAALMLSAASHASHTCPTVNGGSGEAISVKRIVETIASSLPSSCKPRFSGEIRAGDPVHFQADLTEAIAWGWRPGRHWSDGVSEYVAWYRRQSLDEESGK